MGFRPILRLPPWLALSACLLVAAGAAELDSELWPGEGVPRFAAKAGRLTLHQEPDASSPVAARLDVEPGQEITYDRTRYRTIAEGRVIARAPGRLQGRNLGDIEHLSEDRYYAAEPALEDLPYAVGNSFAYLQDRAEGTCLIRDHGSVLEVDGCPWQSGAHSGVFAVAREPVTQWWIEVTEDAQPLGWLQVDEAVVNLLPRGF